MALFFKNPNDPNSLHNKAAIVTWLMQYSIIANEHTVTITELPCPHKHDNCADYSTLITIVVNNNGNEMEFTYIINKPLIYIRKHDVKNLLSER
jgi:hypothetical protein